MKYIKIFEEYGYFYKSIDRNEFLDNEKKEFSNGDVILITNFLKNTKSEFSIDGEIIVIDYFYDDNTDTERFIYAYQTEDDYIFVDNSGYSYYQCDGVEGFIKYLSKLNYL